MTASGTLTLYTRAGCHLCELAAAMLDELEIDWCPVDIESDEALEERYGLVIPVVRSGATKKELLFPFGKEQLSRFLEEIQEG